MYVQTNQPTNQPANKQFYTEVGVNCGLGRFLESGYTHRFPSGA